MDGSSTTHAPPRYYEQIKSNIPGLFKTCRTHQFTIGDNVNEDRLFIARQTVDNLPLGMNKGAISNNGKLVTLAPCFKTSSYFIEAGSII
jgi:hypothetical protein